MVELRKFPSVFREAFSSDKNPVVIRKKRFVLGEEALEMPTFANWIENVDKLVEYYPLFIEYIQKYFETKITAISIPLELWGQYKDNDAKTPIINKLKEIEQNYELTVLPQGLIVVRYLKDTNEIQGGNFLVLDGGFKTLNVSITDGKKIYLMKSFYDELGLRPLVTKFFREEVKKVYPEITSHYTVLNKYFVSGEIPAGFHTIDVSKEKKRVLKPFIMQMLSRVSNEIGKVNVKFDGIIITGGISHYINEKMLKTTNPVVIPKEKEFTNAVAMHFYTKGSVLDLGFGDAKICLVKNAEENQSL